MQIEWVVGLMIASIAISALLLHFVMRKPETSILKSFDKQSLLVFRIIYPSSIAMGFYFYYSEIGYMEALDNTWTELVAVVLFVFGMTLRWIAILSLKERFTVKVTIIKEHNLKTDGVYKWIRHPSYSGLLIYYIGLGLAMHNVLSLALLTVSVIPVLIYRMNIEEQMLFEHFGANYANYKSKTSRLVPGIY